MKQKIQLITYAILLFAVVMNFGSVLSFLGEVVAILFPIFVGFVVAFIISVPMNGFQKGITRLFRKAKHKPGEKVISLVSLLLTLMCILLVVVMIGTVLIPEIVTSVKNITALVQQKWPEWAAILSSYDIDTTPITEWFAKLEFGSMVSQVLSGAGEVINVVAGTAATTISGIVTIGFAIVIMFYVLLSKQDIARQCKKLIFAFLKREKAERVVYVAELTRTTFTKFLSGQCVESIILGLLIFLSFCVFRLPYAGLVAMLTAVCAFIPYIGAFISCGVGVILTLISNPSQAILCFVVYEVVQFVENQFIYPHVVGTSVGLSPLWTLLAVILGGKLFGLMGMIFFIPVLGVIYTLIRERTNQKLRDKRIFIE